MKLRLGDAGGHARVAELLAPQCAGTFLQENFFFDGASAELSSRMSVLRLRFFNRNERAVLTLKVGLKIAATRYAVWEPFCFDVELRDYIEVDRHFRAVLPMQLGLRHAVVGWAAWMLL